jgi:hypothetical protein
MSLLCQCVSLFFCDRERERDKPQHTRTGADPTSPARTKQQARDEHAMRGENVYVLLFLLLTRHRLRTLRYVPEPARYV